MAVIATIFAHLLLAWAMAASARAAASAAPSADGPLPPPAARAKLERMRYGLQQLLPQAAVHWQRVRACDVSLPQLS